MQILGIDLGTTGTKAVLYDISGKIVSESYTEYSVSTPQSGWVELDPILIWDALKENISKTINYSKEKNFAMSFSVLGDAVIPIGKDNALLYPAMLSADIRSSKYVKQVEQHFGDKYIFEYSGRWAHTMCPLTKILWIKDNMPDIYKNTAKFLDVLSWINLKLGFSAIMDSSSASATLYYDINNKKINDNVLEWAKIDKKKLPLVGASGEHLGTLSSEIATELGFKPGSRIDVSLGAMDQLCNALGTGTVEPGDSSCSTGTVECATIILPETISDDELFNHHFIKVPTAIKDQFANMTVLWTGGGSLKWFRNNFCQEEIKEAQEKGINVYDLIEQGERPISDVFFLPHLAGSGTPWWDSLSKGAFIGLSLASNKKQMIDAVMEGVTFSLDISMKALEKLGLEKKRFAVIGGGSKSEKWNQLKADILNRKVISMIYKEGGALGASILAGYGIGLFKSMESKSKELAKVEKDYLPNKNKVSQYNQKFDIFKEIYPALKDINHKISELDYSSSV
jgi:xylulokinase